MQLKLKNGKAVEVRPLQANEDVFEMARYINSLIEGDEAILLDKPVTPEEEVPWLQEKMRLVEKDMLIDFVALDSKRVVAHLEVRRGRGRERDIAGFGIGVVPDFQGQGLGPALLRVGIAEARKRWNPRIINIDYIEGNEKARKAYEKLGFVEVARLPKWTMWRGKARDHVWMVLKE
jgi:RimJ/RimL family protein N-acetyltransferase